MQGRRTPSSLNNAFQSNLSAKTHAFPDVMPIALRFAILLVVLFYIVECFLVDKHYVALVNVRTRGSVCLYRKLLGSMRCHCDDGRLHKRELQMVRRQFCDWGTVALIPRTDFGRRCVCTVRSFGSTTRMYLSSENPSTSVTLHAGTSAPLGFIAMGALIAFAVRFCARKAELRVHKYVKKSNGELRPNGQCEVRFRGGARLTKFRAMG